MKLSKLGAISAFAILSGVSNFAAATTGSFDQGDNLTSYNDGAVFGTAGSPQLVGSFNYTYTFTLDPTSVFDTLVSGWAGLSFTDATLNGSHLLPSSSGSTHYLSLNNVSGSSSYTLNITGSGPATGQSFNIALSSVAAVPEPETFAMLLAGLGLIGMVARRRNKVSTA